MLPEGPGEPGVLPRGPGKNATMDEPMTRIIGHCIDSFPRTSLQSAKTNRVFVEQTRFGTRLGKAPALFRRLFVGRVFRVPVFFFVTLVLACSASGESTGRGAAEKYQDPAVPERFEYRISWMGIRAGRARLEWFNGSERRVRSMARSDDWLSTFYKVRDEAESVMGPDGRPKSFRIRQREGHYRSNKETIFGEDSITYVDHRKKKRKTLDPEGKDVFDVLSGFSQLRRRPLTVGTTEYLDICDSGKIYTLEVRVLRRETLRLGKRSVRTLVVRPILKSDGLFKTKGKITIWLSDDRRRIPLRVETKVLIGTVVARLENNVF